MHNQWGFFLPFTTRTGFYKPVVIKIESFGMGALNKPYFSMMNEVETVRLFLHAVRSEVDDPKAYLSKSLAESIDLNEIKNYLGTAACYTYLQKFDTNLLGNRKTNSILVMEENTIIHLHMMQEPGLGLWKIYGIEKE